MKLTKRYGPKKIAIIGDVDNGKSTLIGQILHSSGSLLDDQRSELLRNSIENKLNLASITDGLTEEREKNITIDVSHRFLYLGNERYMFYDCPGHSEFIQNMITAVSNVSISLILVDVLQGVTEQLRKHIKVLKLMRVKNLVFCINKMDLVNFNKSYFLKLKEDILSLAGEDFVCIIPISAMLADNVLSNTLNMPWYEGLTLLECLNLITDSPDNDYYSYFLTQGFSFKNIVYGQFVGDSLKQDVKLYNPLTHKKYNAINLVEGTKNTISYKSALTFKFDSISDLTRGDVLIPVDQKRYVSDILKLNLYWFSTNKYCHSKEYEILHLNRRYTIESLDFLESNAEIIKAKIKLAESILFTSYEVSRDLGRIILLDANTYETMAFGITYEV